MATITRTSDVFISHSAADEKAARQVAQSLQAVGLTPFHLGMLAPGADVSEDIWQALAESRAVIAIVSPANAENANIMLEIGAASAWNKPVFVLVTDASAEYPKGILQNYPIYPLSRLDDVIRAIHADFRPFSKEEHDVLGQVYRETGVPVDRLSQSSESLREITEDFWRRTNKRYSEERVLSELWRLRKMSQLPRRLSAHK